MQLHWSGVPDIFAQAMAEQIRHVVARDGDSLDYWIMLREPGQDAGKNAVLNIRPHGDGISISPANPGSARLIERHVAMWRNIYRN